MPIYYSLIARGPTVLVDYTDNTGNFQQITLTILERVPQHDTKCTYVSGSYQFHVIVEDELVYLCMTDDGFGKTKSYAFLAEIKQRFSMGTLKQRALTAHAYELRRDFGQVLQSQMQRFSSEGYSETDKMDKLKKEVEEVKGVMTENIDKVLQRGEKIDILVGKTEEMEHSASTFRKSAGQLKKKMWWQNTRMCVILVIVLLLIITVITLIVLHKEDVI